MKAVIKGGEFVSEFSQFLEDVCTKFMVPLIVWSIIQTLGGSNI